MVSLQSFIAGVTHSCMPPPPTCKAYPIALLLRDHCAIYARLPTPPCHAIHHTILVMAISCKGQVKGSGLGFTRAAAKGYCSSSMLLTALKDVFLSPFVPGGSLIRFNTHTTRVHTHTHTHARTQARVNPWRSPRSRTSSRRYI